MRWELWNCCITSNLLNESLNIIISNDETKDSKHKMRYLIHLGFRIGLIFHLSWADKHLFLLRNWICFNY